MTQFVFAIAAVAYYFMAVALFNVLFFFTLAKPQLVLFSIAPALLVNLAVGFGVSRWFSYEYASLGLLAGAIVFALLSSVAAWDVFRRFDFYYYAAY